MTTSTVPFGCGSSAFSRFEDSRSGVGVVFGLHMVAGFEAGGVREAMVVCLSICSFVCWILSS